MAADADMTENPVIKRLLLHARKTYRTEADQPFAAPSDALALRHTESRKWFGLVFSASRRQLGLTGDPEELLDILNVKLDPVFAGVIRKQPGILPGYHMNHTLWTTVLLDGSVPDETIYELLDLSYQATAARKKGKSRTKT